MSMTVSASWGPAPVAASAADAARNSLRLNPWIIVYPTPRPRLRSANPVILAPHDGRRSLPAVLPAGPEAPRRADRLSGAAGLRHPPLRRVPDGLLPAPRGRSGHLRG